ncbi:MAG: hypothetical protein LBJ94_03155 [Puniceicoccales bacterium]|nr:hypothetical protein [Puniceicoccales bacterium]
MTEGAATENLKWKNLSPKNRLKKLKVRKKVEGNNSGVGDRRYNHGESEVEKSFAEESLKFTDYGFKAGTLLQ